MSKRTGTLYPGVYQREAAGRTFKGKPDIGFDITYHHEGKKTWERVGWLSDGYSARLAADVLAERKRSIRHGDELPKDKQSAPCLEEVAKKYFEWAEVNHTRKGKDSRIRYDVHLKDLLGEKRLNEISSFDLERLKADLLKKELAPATVRHCLVLVRAMFNKAIAWNFYQGSNPVKKVKLPTLQNQRTRFLSHDEAARLLDSLRINPQIKNPKKLLTAKPTALHDLCLLSLHTGMRAGECFALKGQDIDIANGIITIRDPKNKTTRHAYMTEAVRAMLERRKPQKPSALLFPNKKGKETQQISQAFQRTANKLGFNKGVKDRREMITFHSLRHSFASWLALQGETLQTIGELLGHKGLTMTKRYSHLLPDHKRRATVALEKGFEESKKKSAKITTT